MSTQPANTPGQLPLPANLVNVPRLITAYYSLRPDPAIPAQRVAFGTSGHRGSAFETSFNDAHIAASTQPPPSKPPGGKCSTTLFAVQESGPETIAPT